MIFWACPTREEWVGAPTCFEAEARWLLVGASFLSNPENFAIDKRERLQRVLAARGVGSRRHAEDLIRAGRVSVDDRVVTELGTKVDPLKARIHVDGKPVHAQTLRYILLNKPRGYITTTTDERGRRTVMDLVPVPERLYPVGRLDRDTEGLILLTNDGEVANRVMHPRYELTKEYQVLTLTRPDNATLRQLEKGVVIDGKRVTPDEIRILRETREGLILKIVLHEGLNRIVRRLMDDAGISIERLRRVRIGPLSLAGIPVGSWRDFTPGERTTLLEALRLEQSNSEVSAHSRGAPASQRPERSRRGRQQEVRVEHG